MPNLDPAQPLPGEDAPVLGGQLAWQQQVAAAPVSPLAPPAARYVGPPSLDDPPLTPTPAASTTTAPALSPAPRPTETLPNASPVRQPSSAGSGAGGDLRGIEQQIRQGASESATALGESAAEQRAGGDAASAAHSDVSGARANAAADLAAQQLYVREQQQKLAQQDRANFERARDYVIPDFWQSRPGSLVGAAITVGLSGAASALLGSSANPALNAIQHNIDAYYDAQKEKQLTLFRYAEQTGKANDATRAQLQQSLTDLVQQHAYTIQAAADRVDAVAAQYKGRFNAAQADELKAQLKAQAAKELLGVYQARTSRIEAYASAIRASAAANAERDAGSERADEAAFRTYVQAPHNKAAETLKLRLSALDSAAETLKNVRASSGEVVGAIDKAIAADAGQGTRGVSMSQLHGIVPKLVSSAGAISDKVSNDWDGSAGREFRAAALRMVADAKRAREAEYQRNASDLEKNLALTPHGQRNKDFARTATLQLYPQREAPVAQKPAAMQVGGRVYRLQADGTYQ